MCTVKIDSTLNGQAILIEGTPQVEDGYFEVDAVMWNGIDVWPMLCIDDRLIEVIDNLACKALPRFFEACAESAYQDRDSTMFRFGA